jgi:hypothetical protein
MKKAIHPLLPENLFAGGSTAGWWLKCVQLELEVRGVFGRTTGRPQRSYKTGK